MTKINFSDTDNIIKQWYALYTKPKHEFKAATQLEVQNVDYYLPTISKVKQWSDRKKKVKEPLIRGYIFIKGSEKERLIALQQNSIVRCVSERGKPAVIPESQMNNFIKFVQDGYEYRVVNELTKGMKVRIKSGPMSGVEGVIIEEPEHRSVAVSIDLLNRTVVTRIQDESLLEILIENPVEENN